MQKPRRGRSELSRTLRAQGSTWVQIAELLRVRYKVNARVAFRYAHGWSQGQVARLWCQRWPDDPKAGKNVSYWEQWPAESGRTPSLAVLVRLAELYECGVGDLLADLPNYRHRDDATGRLPEAVAAVGGLPGEHVVPWGGDGYGADEHKPGLASSVRGGAVAAAGLAAASVQVTLSPDTAVTVRYQDADRVAIIAGPVQLLIDTAGADVRHLCLSAPDEQAVPGGARLYSISPNGVARRLVSASAIDAGGKAGLAASGSAGTGTRGSADPV